MDYEDNYSNGLNIDNTTPEERIKNVIEDDNTIVKTNKNSQTIDGDLTINGTLYSNIEVIHDVISFSTRDSLIHQAVGNTGDSVDIGYYATYDTDKYTGIIRKNATDRFYVFNNETNEPSTILNTETMDKGTIVIRNATADDEAVNKQQMDGNLSTKAGLVSDNTFTGTNTIHNNTFLRLRNAGDNNGWNLSRHTASNWNYLILQPITASDSKFKIETPNGDNIFEIKSTDSSSDSQISVYGQTNIHNSVIRIFNPSSSTTLIKYSPTNASTITNSATLRYEPEYNNNGSADYPSYVQNFHGSLGSFDFEMNGQQAFRISRDFKNRSFTDLRMDDYKIINMEDGTDAKDAVNKQQLDTKLDLSGGDITGEVTITNAYDTTILKLMADNGSSLHGINIRYIESLNNFRFGISDAGAGGFMFNRYADYLFRIDAGGNVSYKPLSMSSNKITSLADGTSSGDAVNKGQLDTKLDLTGGVMTGKLELIGDFDTALLYLGASNGGTYNKGLGISYNSSFDNYKFNLRGDSPNGFIFTRNDIAMFRLDQDDGHASYKPLSMSSNKITSLANGTTSGDAVNKGQLDTKLSTSGGNMSGNISMNSNAIQNLSMTGNDYDAANKIYVDNAISGISSGLPTTGGTMSGNIDMDGNRITDLPQASGNTEPVRKQEMDLAFDIRRKACHYRELGPNAFSSPNAFVDVLNWSSYVVPTSGKYLLRAVVNTFNNALTTGDEIAARIKYSVNHSILATNYSYYSYNQPCNAFNSGETCTTHVLEKVITVPPFTNGLDPILTFVLQLNTNNKTLNYIYASLSIEIVYDS